MCSQDETSEAFIGEWAESRGIRDQLVIATKVILKIVGSNVFSILYSTRRILSVETTTLKSRPTTPETTQSP